MTIRPGFEHISPSPTMTGNVTMARLLRFDWDSNATVVRAFKVNLKADLRRAQHGRCCYCRRHLSDDNVTHLEHVLEKASFPEYRFEILNLGLSCATCNTQKYRAYRHFQSLIKAKVSKHVFPDPGSRISQVLKNISPSPSSLPVSESDYRWLHPHHDRYSQHITILKGWIYRWRTAKGRRTVRGLDLNALALLERRAMEERINARRQQGALSWMVGALGELTFNQTADVCAAVANSIRRAKK
ncbi:hypothetical protein KPL74_17370 [Bacillus sp. NP157]|nr:hypothetical protein KPL74_17370 [Bacillus sp. NP157]